MHFYPPLIPAGTLPPEYYCAPLLLAAVFVIIAWKFYFRRDLIFGLLFFIMNLVMVVQLVPLGQAIVAERYTYIPYLGLFFPFGLYCSKLIFNKNGRFFPMKSFMIAAIGIILTFFSIATGTRNKIWKNSMTLSSDIAYKYPENYYACFLRGEAEDELANTYAGKNERQLEIIYHTKALSDFEKSIRINPEFPLAYNNRGCIYGKNGLIEKAIEDFNKAITLKPDYASAWANRANAKTLMKDFNGAYQDFNRSIQLDSGNGSVYYNRGVLLYNQQRKDAACDDWKNAIKHGYDEAGGVIRQFCR
jgi:protein O-mannosyl-transferase